MRLFIFLIGFALCSCADDEPNLRTEHAKNRLNGLFPFLAKTPAEHSVKVVLHQCGHTSSVTVKRSDISDYLKSADKVFPNIQVQKIEPQIESRNLTVVLNVFYDTNAHRLNDSIMLEFFFSPNGLIQKIVIKHPEVPKPKGHQLPNHAKALQILEKAMYSSSEISKIAVFHSMLSSAGPRERKKILAESDVDTKNIHFFFSRMAHGQFPENGISTPLNSVEFQKLFWMKNAAFRPIVSMADVQSIRPIDGGYQARVEGVVAFWVNISTDQGAVVIAKNRDGEFFDGQAIR